MDSPRTVSRQGCYCFATRDQSTDAENGDEASDGQDRL